MAAPPNVPNIQKSEGADRSGTAAATATPGRVIPNAPARTVEQALRNAEAQVDATK